MGKLLGVDPVWTSVNCALRMSGIGRTHFYQLMNDGKIVSTKVGRKRLVSVASIKELGGKQPAPPIQIASPQRAATKREITQIVFANPFLWALCNDGTVWRYATDGERAEWVRAISIPQGDED